MKICDEAVDHDGVNKVMQENEKMTILFCSLIE